MEAMEIDPDLSDQRRVPPLATLLEAPVFMSTREIWCYVLDTCKEWSKRVSPKSVGAPEFIDQLSDINHGYQVIGQNEIRNVVSEWYQDFQIGRSTQERRRMDKYCDNNKFSNIFRFIRNFSQHAGESMPEAIFRKYFPENYRNKLTFVQSMLVHMPTLLIYSWCLDNQLEFNATTQPICYEFVVMLRHSLEKYSKENRLATFTTVRNNQTIIYEVMKSDVQLYNRYAGMVIRIKMEEGESFVEVDRKHYKESIKFKVNTPQTIPQYRISFGAHEMCTNPELENFIFVNDSNLHDVIKELDVNHPSIPNIQVEIETTQLLRSYILKTAKLQINSAQVPLKNIAKAEDEFFETMEYDTWKRLLFNEPLEMFSKGCISDLSVEGNRLPEFNRIIQSKKQLQIFTLSTSQHRTTILKNLYYEFGKSGYVSLFVPVVKLYETPEQSSLSQKLTKYYSGTDLEKFVIEKVFAAGFPETIILFDEIDQIPPEELVSFLMNTVDLNIRIVGTAPIFCNEFRLMHAWDISLGRSCCNNTNG